MLQQQLGAPLHPGKWYNSSVGVSHGGFVGTATIALAGSRHSSDVIITVRADLPNFAGCTGGKLLRHGLHMQLISAADALSAPAVWLDVTSKPLHDAQSPVHRTLLPGTELALAGLVQVSRQASRLHSPLLHAVLAGGHWDVMTLEAVMQDGSGMTRRVSLLDPPPAQRPQGEARVRVLASYPYCAQCTRMFASAMPTSLSI